ncbi:MAG: hypothetical protein ABJF11_05440 [Reichenbachiella sp.]|uniref:hypothetical protein n=1 Tax=Reichenbachiella sp. TaxID=2184521 RepID=UPI003266FE9C
MKLIWNNNLDPEVEDRLQFLSLSYEKRWEYMMKLIMSNQSKKIPTNNKKRIEWI